MLTITSNQVATKQICLQRKLLSIHLLAVSPCSILFIILLQISHLLHHVLHTRKRIEQFLLVMKHNDKEVEAFGTQLTYMAYVNLIWKTCLVSLRFSSILYFDYGAIS